MVVQCGRLLVGHRRASHPDYRVSTLPDKLCALGRLGQKTGGGWYDYPEGPRRAVPSPVTAQLVDANGVPFAYRGTPLEAAATAGGVSRVYAGLLRAHDGHWRVVQQAIGPTDVAWEAWPTQFGAPAALFATD